MNIYKLNDNFAIDLNSINKKCQSNQQLNNKKRKIRLYTLKLTIKKYVALKA